MTTRLLRTALLALVACFALARGTSAHAQIVVTSEQNLQFGLLTPGVSMTVAPTDAARRGALRISTRGRFNVTFQLPSALVAPGGGSIPLVFGPTSGRVEIRGSVTTFDPAAGTSFRINPADLSADVYLGATAQPGTGARAGAYTATIVMLVVQTGS